MKLRNATNLSSLGLASLLSLAAVAGAFDPARSTLNAAAGERRVARPAGTAALAGKGDSGAPADFLSRAQAHLVDREYWASETREGLQAPNRRHALRSHFDPSGVRVRDRGVSSRSDLLGLTLSGLGRGDRLEAVGPGELRHTEGRVEIERAKLGLVEWFENSEAGLEQGFTLAERPRGLRGASESGEGASPSARSAALVLELSVSGSRARLRGGSVLLTSEAGRKLDYGKLAVVDARGVSLAAHFEVPAPDRIRLLVEDAGAAYPIVIDPLLTQTADAVLESNQAYDGSSFAADFGFSVASAGDVNGDGFDDVIVGARSYDAGQTDEGAAFVFLGSATGLSSGNPSTAGTVLESNQGSTFLGTSVAGAGDVNGDGFGDVIVGAPGYTAGEFQEGAAFVFLGSASGIENGNPTTAHAQFESNQANNFFGVPGGAMGDSVASAGDVNGDGYSDVIVGAPGYLLAHGGAFVFLGSASGLTDGNPTTAHSRLVPLLDQPGPNLGQSVAGAGDVNADGFDDVIVGAPLYDAVEPDEGAAFVFLGSASGIVHASPTTAHAQLESNQPSGFLGRSVASAGDVNGDGYGDVIVGASGYDVSGVADAGAAFLFRGSVSGIADGNPSTANSSLLGSQTSGVLGISVGSAGDLNGDGFGDFVVGASGMGSAGQLNEGNAFVFLGWSLGPHSLDDFFVQLEGDQAGAALGLGVASAGDVNGDGLDDLIVGASRFDSGQLDEGAVFVYLGGANAAPSIVESVSGFEGSSQLDGSSLSFGDLFYIPPDTMGAVGLTQFVEFNNKNVSVYDKLSGTLQSRVDPQTFWQQAGIPIAGGFHTLGDQRVLFDPVTQRWIASSNGGTSDIINLAVSATSDPLGTWRGVQFAGVAAGAIAGFPTLGVDREGVYVGTVNWTSNFGSYIGAALNVIPKADLFGATPTLARKTTFSIPGSGPGPHFYVVQGAVHWNSSGTRGHFVADNLSSDDLWYFAVDGVDSAGATMSTPTLADGAAAFHTNDPARQPDGTRLVNTASNQSSNNVVQVGNRIFATRTVTRQLLSSSSRYTSVNWQVIDATSGALIEEGDIGGGGFDYYQSSIAVNTFGEAVIGFNRSGSQTADADGDGRPDGRITFMAQTFVSDAGGGLDVAGHPLILRVSDVDDYRCGPHSFIQPGCFNAWGDTSAVTIDPADPRTFYAIGEYAAPWAIYPNIPFTTDERSVWHTYVARIRLVPEPGLGAALMTGVGLISWIGSRRRR